MRLGLLVALVLAVAPAAARAADSIALDVSPPSPVDGTSVTVLAGGHADADADALAYAHPAAAGGCAATPAEASDRGDTLMLRESPAAGDYRVGDRATASFDGPGDWLVCGWLMNPSDRAGAPRATTSTAVTVARATVELTLGAPPAAASDRPYAVMLHAAANAPRTLVVDTRPASAGPCGALPKDEPDGATFIYGPLMNAREVDGSLDQELDLDPLAAGGTDRICAWVVRTDNSGLVQYADATASADVQITRAPKRFDYAGRTSQHRRMLISGTGSYVKAIGIRAKVRCNGPVRQANGRRWNRVSHLYLTGSHLHGAAFTAQGTFSLSDQSFSYAILIEVRRAGEVVTGSFRIAVLPKRAGLRAAGRTRCDSGRVRFRLASS